MSGFSKQFAIIEKLKSLVRKTTGFRKKTDINQISEDVARKIQRNSFELSRVKINESNTPPYKLIAEQLQVEDDQIFRAAVLSLADIGINCRKYAADILELLEKSLDADFRTEEQMQYVKKYMEYIKTSGK